MTASPQVDGSGAIDDEEVAALFADVGLEATEKDIRGLISFLDADHSGSVEFAEFVKLMEMAKGRRTDPSAPLDAVGALKDMFEERRKAEKVKGVAVGAALAALHRGDCDVTGVGELAASTARVLVGHCGETDAVLGILKEASVAAAEAAGSLARTELMLACESGDVASCKKALAKGASPDSRARDCDGAFGASGTPQAESSSLMSSPRDPLVEAEAKRANGRTCLLVALENGHAPVAFELLKAGASPDLADDADGLTPLMMAPKALTVVKHAKLVDLLFGAAPPGSSSTTQTPTDATVETPSGRTAASYAAAFGRDAYLRRLAAAGCPMNGKPGSSTPLILAAKHDHVRCVEYLCNTPGLKIDLEAIDESGKSAVRHAQAGDLKPVLEVLNKARVKAAQAAKDAAEAGPEGEPHPDGKKRRKSQVMRGSSSLGDLGQSGRRKSHAGRRSSRADRSSRPSQGSFDDHPAEQ